MESKSHSQEEVALLLRRWKEKLELAELGKNIWFNTVLKGLKYPYWDLQGKSPGYQTYKPDSYHHTIFHGSSIFKVLQNATENYFYFNLKFNYSLPSLPV